MIDLATVNILDLLPSFVVYKDLDSRIIYMNQFSRELGGYQSLDEILSNDITDHDLKCEAALFADQFISEDKVVMKTGEKLQILGRYGYSNGNWHTIIGTKQPIYDDENQLLGTVGCYQDVTKTNFINSYLLLSKQNKKFIGKKNVSYYVRKDCKEFGLSSRQTECLYYVIRGFTANDIAIRLNLSKRTIESYVDDIKNKMSCQNKQELIDKAICRGFISIIPESLLED